MSLLHPGILIGLGLVALPVILHLLLRQKPKKLIFPAMRLIQQRRKQNSRRLRLRHIWLLLLRMLAIGLLVFAIARPSLPAANYSLSLGETVTLFAVIAGAVAVYFFVLSRWRSRLPRYEYVSRRSSLRGWTTGLTLLALLLAVGLPYQRRVAAEITAPPPGARIDVPVAAVFLFDTSFSMGYQQEGKTRLDLARQIAVEHLGALPSGSRVAVADVSNDNPVIFQTTLGSAQARIDALELQPVRIPLNDRLRTALLTQEDDRREKLDEQGSVPADSRRDRYVRRVYVFTDLAETAWRTAGSQLLRNEIERLEDVSVYLVDVGERHPQNVAVTNVSLSRQRIPQGGSLVVAATVDGIGIPGGERTIELSVADGNGRSITQGRRTVSLESGEPQRVEFDTLSSLIGPVVQGEVRLVSSDPLGFDDVRHFTVEIGAPPKVLVVAPSRQDASIWLYTLNPGEEVKFATEFAPPSRLSTTALQQYDVISLINVPELSDEQWHRLAQFVDGGGGLAIFLGDESIDSVSYNRGQAQAFLPAELLAYARGDFRLSLDGVGHPALRKIKDMEDRGAVAILENEAEVYKFWKVQPAQGSSVLMTYTNDERSPALIERLHGKGRVLVFTTAVDPKHPLRRWNTLPIMVNGWAWLALAQPMTEYLARLTDNVYNVEAGETVTLLLPASDHERQLLLRRPDLTQTRRTVPADATRINIDDARLVGHYELAPSGNTPALVGFSVNAPAEESDFTRMTRESFEDLLGKDRYQVARDIGELEANINLSDIGKEVFPVIMLLAVLAFCGEHLVANRFYESTDESGPAGRTALEPATTAG